MNFEGQGVKDTNAIYNINFSKFLLFWFKFCILYHLRKQFLIWELFPLSVKEKAQWTRKVKQKRLCTGFLVRFTLDLNAVLHWIFSPARPLSLLLKALNKRLFFSLTATQILEIKVVAEFLLKCLNQFKKKQSIIFWSWNMQAVQYGTIGYWNKIHLWVILWTCTLCDTSLHFVIFLSSVWLLFPSTVYGRRDIYEPLTRTSSRIVRVHSLWKIKISAHRPKIFTNKYLIPTYWIVTNENICL